MGGMLPGVIPPTSCINQLLCRYSGTNHVVILLDKGGAGRGRMRCTAAARVQANCGLLQHEANRDAQA